jgi:hypothetical protein
MITPVEPDDASSLARDIARESWQSFTAMSRWSQVTLIAGMVVHVAAVLPPLDAVPHPFIGWIRVAAFVAIVVGLVENAKTLDEFYLRLYLDACAISVVASSVIIYAGYELGFSFGVRAVAVIAFTFLVGFVASFARLRRRA